MKLENFPEIERITQYKNEIEKSLAVYRRDHPQFRQFDFPEHFYFKIYNDRLKIYWAVIIKEEKWCVYFISMLGRAFDKLEFATKKQAQRALRRNKFSFSTNKYCPYKPISPIYINIGEGRKSAPYSKGNLWNKIVHETKTVDYKENEYTAFWITGGVFIMIAVFIWQLFSKPAFWLSLKI